MFESKYPLQSFFLAVRSVTKRAGQAREAWEGRETTDFPTGTSWHGEFRAVAECIRPAILYFLTK
tara:strand:+ start:457 stop:651 length:195 start_codon:yes stop_codon:yes gene_type:complete